MSTENVSVVLDSTDNIRAQTWLKIQEGKYWARFIHQLVPVLLNNTQKDIHLVEWKNRIIDIMVTKIYINNTAVELPP